MRPDRYPCRGVQYETQRDASDALRNNQDGERHYVWHCADGHFHEGVSDE